MEMKKIELSSLSDNVFEMVGKEWMLITAGTPEKFNTMTASWGCLGWLWNKPVAVVFVRPERYTHDFVETNSMLTLSFLGTDKAMRDAYNICGTRSGRDGDKVAAAGLQPIETEGGNVTFSGARLALECRKLYKGDIKPEEFIDQDISKWYGGQRGGYHDVYVVEIVAAYAE